MVCAIFNSQGHQAAAASRGQWKTGNLRSWRRFLSWPALVVACGTCAGLFAADTNQISANHPLARTNIAARAKQIYFEARRRFQSETNSVEAAWEFGRACFDWADVAAKNSERAPVAEEGIAACRNAIAREPKSAPAHYYLGMNLGELAQTKGIGALKIVKEMEREFQTARDLDEPFDHAGPDRNLGLLYRDAPAVFSIGSRSRARAHLQRAVELAPQYPENRLNLIETLLKWNERADAGNAFNSTDKVWAEARATFSGEAWEAAWIDWDARLRKTKMRIGQKPVQSPRHLD